MYVVGPADFPKWAVMSCPCGCGERLEISLRSSHSPSWQFNSKAGRVTLYPSVWLSEKACGSHFWVRDGRIEWVTSMRGSLDWRTR